jgi:hypothetical protein
MPNRRLTSFLVSLLTDECLLKEFLDDKEKALTKRQFKVDDVIVQAILVDDTDGVKAFITGQQGGRGSGRREEANQLAQRASDLAKWSVEMAAEWAALAEASRPASARKTAKKKR